MMQVSLLSTLLITESIHHPIAIDPLNLIVLGAEVVLDALDLVEHPQDGPRVEEQPWERLPKMEMMKVPESYYEWLELCR